MQYQSTRGAGEVVSAQRAIVQGLAKDGGLFVPLTIPKIDSAFIESLIGMDYLQRARCVLSPWLPDFSADELAKLIAGAYQNSFDTDEIAPVVKVKDGLFMLELWHGPTLAFKDMALQLMPHLLSASRDKVDERREILILVATSGDTGKAALEGFCDVPGVSIVVFYPDGGVSEAQRLQMVTQKGDNTHVVAVKGNFDDAQTGVKHIFSDAEYQQMLNEQGIVLSSANSINLGRLLPQVVYYFSAYADLCKQGALKPGDPLDVCVPTGNFGNILAAAYAKEMGLPLRKLICASNSNNVLADFLETGIYDRRRDFHLTTSPSMDILISSNLERMLHHLLNGDADQVKSMMADLRDKGCYQLPEEALSKLKDLMPGGWASEEQVAAQIAKTFNEDHYLMDPHTAVAVCVLEQWQKDHRDSVPAIVASTASPYKFGRAVLEAVTGEAVALSDFDCCDQLAKLSNQQVPNAISELPKLTVRHGDVCEISAMPDAVIRAMNLER